MTDASASLLTGWGRVSSSAARVTRPSDPDEVAQLLADGAPGPLIARGAGRSYGDAAQSAGGTVLDLAAFASIGPIDASTGEVEVGGGLHLGELFAHVLPRGFTVPVTPGTRQVTVGGAIAADVHGKNHHRDGSFCSHVRRLTLVTPTGTVDVSPQHDPELFWATAGGMGLTGVVIAARVRLLAVESAWMLVDTVRFSSVEQAMAAMEAGDADVRYSVAWVDCTGSGGGGLGRAVLSTGEHAPAASLRGASARDPFRVPPDSRITVPFTAPRGLLGPRSARAFNTVWFHSAPRRRAAALHTLGSFFHPLDGIGGWNRLYGPDGFVQYQFVVPPEHGDLVMRALSRIAASRVPSTLGVLKRFGPGNPGPLSFPIEGWTLALDFPASASALPELLDELDEQVVEAGGRVYLAKDARLSPASFRAMYPRLAELQRIRRRVDPAGRLQSDLTRRLGIAAPGDQPGGHGA